MAKSSKSIKKSESKKVGGACTPPKNIWCVSIMAVAIIVLTWVSARTWSRVTITILAALIFIRSMMINCCQ